MGGSDRCRGVSIKELKLGVADPASSRRDEASDDPARGVQVEEDVLVAPVRSGDGRGPVEPNEILHEADRNPLHAPDDRKRPGDRTGILRIAVGHLPVLGDHLVERRDHHLGVEFLRKLARHFHLQLQKLGFQPRNSYLVIEQPPDDAGGIVEDQLRSNPCFLNPVSVHFELRSTARLYKKMWFSHPGGSIHEKIMKVNAQKDKPLNCSE